MFSSSTYLSWLVIRDFSSPAAVKISDFKKINKFLDYRFIDLYLIRFCHVREVPDISNNLSDKFVLLLI